MKTLDKGKDRVEKIVKVLREETLEPAKEEAQRIIDEAKAEAERIVKAAEKEAEDIVERGRQNIQKERGVFESSLKQAGKQAMEALRQDIEEKLFNGQLGSILEGGSHDPQLVAKLINCIVDAVSKNGSDVDLSAFVPAAVSAKDVNAALGEATLRKLREGGVAVGKFKGGAQVRLNDQRMTIDISETALKELLSSYVRKDFRKLLFA